MDKSNFSRNFRKYRKKCNLSQANIAKELYLTAQTISKWEIGISEPGLDNLCKISQMFNMSIDDLLENKIVNETEHCFIGIDGGGTKTEFLLFKSNGNILGRTVLEGSNPNICGIDSTVATLKKGIDSLILSKDVKIDGICAGLAGSRSGQNNKIITNMLEKIYPYKIKITSDIENVIGSADSNSDCIAAICGTGSCVYAQVNGKLHRFGGWGYLFDDGGSGYGIGRDAIKAALAEEDGVGSKTLLTELIENKIGGNVWSKIDELYRAENEYIASLSKLVFDAYKDDDKVASDILNNNISRLALFINAASKKYPSVNDVIISGGITKNVEIFYQIIKSKINSNLNIIFPKLPQIYGACTNCCKYFGNAEIDFQDNFEKDYLQLLNNNL